MKKKFHATIIKFRHSCRTGVNKAMLMTFVCAVFIFFLMLPNNLSAIQGDNYGVTDNTIVVTPVGYEKSVRLSNGAVITLYPDVLSIGDVTNCHAVMFYILSPRQQFGKRFLLRHSGCTCYMCEPLAPMTNLYQIGRYYLFDWQHTVSNILLSTYDIRQPVPELKMERDWGTELYCTVKDVDERIHELDVLMEKNQVLLKEYQSQLLQLPHETSLRMKRHELNCRIFRLEKGLTNDLPNVRKTLLKRREWLRQQDNKGQR